MSTFFRGTPGSVVRLDSPTAQCGVPAYLVNDAPNNEGFTLGGGFAPQYQSHASIVTRLTGGFGVNMQLLHSFGDLVYIYVFGDKLAQVVVSGLSFCGCNREAPHGLDYMIEWWEYHKASNRNEPVALAVGRRLLRGVLADWTFDAGDAEFGLVSWNATIQGLIPTPEAVFVG